MRSVCVCVSRHTSAEKRTVPGICSPFPPWVPGVRVSPQARQQMSSCWAFSPAPPPRPPAPVTYHCLHMEVWRPLSTMWALGTSSGQQAWQKPSLPVKSSCQPLNATKAVLLDKTWGSWVWREEVQRIKCPPYHIQVQCYPCFTYFFKI